MLNCGWNQGCKILLQCLLLFCATANLSCLSFSLLEGGRLGTQGVVWVLAACCLLLALTKHLISNASPIYEDNLPPTTT